MTGPTTSPVWLDADDIETEASLFIDLTNKEQGIITDFHERIQSSERNITENLNADAVSLNAALLIDAGLSPKKSIAYVLSQHGMGSRDTKFTYEDGAELADTSANSIRNQAKQAREESHNLSELYILNKEDRPMHILYTLQGMGCDGSYSPYTGDTNQETSMYICQYDDIPSINEDNLIVSPSELPQFVIFWETRRFNGIHRGRKAAEDMWEGPRSSTTIQMSMDRDASELVELTTTRHTTKQEVIDNVYRFFQENDTGFVWDDVVEDDIKTALDHYGIEYGI